MCSGASLGSSLIPRNLTKPYGLRAPALFWVPPGYLKTSQNCVIDVLRRFAGFLWIIDVSSLKTVKCVYLIITYIYIYMYKSKRVNDSWAISCLVGKGWLVPDLFASQPSVSPYGPWPATDSSVRQPSVSPYGRWLAADLPVSQPQVSPCGHWLTAGSQTSQLQVSAHRGWLMADLQTSQTQVSPYRRGSLLSMNRSLIYVYIYIYWSAWLWWLGKAIVLQRC